MKLPLHRLVLTVCMLLLATRLAAADDPATRAAKRHFQRGEKQFALGKFELALDEYQKAYDAKPLPAFLFNIGQCHRNLGDYEAAIFSFKKFLKLDPDTDVREQVEEYIAELEQEQERSEAKRFGFEKPSPARPAEAAGGRPVYKKWWFWTGLAVVGVAGGVGVYAATRGDGPPDTSLDYNIVFGK